MTDIELKAGERIDQIAATDVQIIQSRDVFSFSIDAILLARFPRLPKKGKIVDMCAGNGAVGLFASSMTDSQIIELEIQERLAEMTQRSIQLNELDEQMTVINDNLNKALNYITTSSVDLIFCNPPYFKLD
ncbi:MAG TPA: SAM-dependent methyltransferase, partial [Lactococcus sp.]|nr:SAM-dependent methyltransferase [Lactococcus sp.]